ncbi:MAG: DNA-3-methyladenine glycosylase I [Pseudomonadales bacterium]
MDSFDSIFQRAAERKGGVDELEALLPKPESELSLKELQDDRVLAEMTKCIFRSGFVWKVVENKWPGFEAAFYGFDVSRCAMLSDEELEALTQDTSIIRNAKKIQSVSRNAAFILDVRADHGSFGAYLADWPTRDIVGLWDDLKQRGDRLGGQTGKFFLRFIGKDTPMFSNDVVKALVAMRIVEKAPTSKKAIAVVQDAFNQWHDESGRDLCEISRVLACSVP